MKHFKHIFLLIFLATVFSTCSKYPDGPEFSLSTKKSRIRGIWILESLLVNGDDSTAIYCNLSTLGCTGAEFGPKGHSVYSVGPEGDTGRWEFSNNQNNIIIYNTSGNGYPPVFVGSK